jgi:predicted signal transduction protein with EAL and GGDEF domain
MLLLPGTVLDAAVTFAERARKAVEAHTFTFEGGTLQRTMSCGVAAWPHPRIGDCDALVKAADDALYVAKETGRNRVIRFDSQAFNEHTQGTADDQHAEVDVSDRALFPSGDRPAGGEDRGAPTRA